MSEPTDAPRASAADDPRTLVSTGWLAGRLGAADIAVLDGSWYLPDMARDAAAEYAAGHIPGARFFDIDAFSDRSSGLPHTVPTPADFAAGLAGFGISDDTQVVVYDRAGLFSAARVWWLFRYMGHARVAVLDGGLPKWRAEGRALDSGTPASGDGRIAAQVQPALIRSADQVAAAAQDGSAQIVDARAAPRFRGEVPEPRPGLRAGHIPGARSLPFTGLLNADGTMKDPDALRAAFAAAGVDADRPVITSCGSGVTAAVLSLGLQRIGRRDHSLYDGSWAEWGQEGGRPVATGAAD